MPRTRWIIAGLVALIVSLAVGYLGYRLGLRTATRGTYIVPARWIPAGALPAPHVETPTVIFDGKVYFFGGFSTYDLRMSVRTDIYDLASGSWSRGADMPYKVGHIQAVVYDDRAWLLGGYAGDHPGTASDASLVYDPREDAWSDGPQLPAPRAGGGTVLLNDRIHYLGGLQNRTEDAATHWAFDPATGEWADRAPLPLPRNQGGCVIHDGRIYLIGGQLGHDGQPVDVDAVDVYDPQNDRWTSAAPLLTSASHMESSTVVLGDRIIVLGGRALYPRSLWERPFMSQDDSLRLAQVYDVAAGIWSAGPHLPVGLLGASAWAYEGDLWIAGGSTNAANFPQFTMYRLSGVDW